MTDPTGTTGQPDAPPRILVAEDNPINQEVILEQLSLLGFTADVADDGQQAYERWQQGRHPLVLTDLQMPRMDGFQFTHALRDHEARQGWPRTRVVALTASASSTEQARCLAAGMDDHLPKPLDLNVLRARLQAWLPAGPAPAAAAAETAAPSTALAAAPASAPAEPDQAASGAEPLLDADVLCQYVGDDPATLAHFRRDYRQRLAPLREALAAAMAQADLSTVASLAHQLKSTSRTVGAMRLGRCSEALEHAARAAQPDEAARHWPAVAAALIDTDRALGLLLQDASTQV